MTQVTEHLETHGVPFEPITHQQAYTSIAEARALGIDASDAHRNRLELNGFGLAPCGKDHLFVLEHLLVDVERCAQQRAERR